ncbi:DALR anticodon binding domain-containing protein [Nostoc linckia NIES-25]|nr:DALR anticodon binding domain-containing protein [Nostoc linckia NIES-25]
MFNKIQTFNYASFKQLVYECLNKYLSINTESTKNEYIEDKKILLYKDRNNRKILYTSSVALQVSNSQNRKAMELASAIALHLSATCGDVFNVQIVPSGLIHFELTDSALAGWLQSLVERSGGVGKVGEAGGESIPNAQYPMPHSSLREAAPTAALSTSAIFPIQHTHARCCSLVLLAHREALIKLKEPLANTNPSFWSLLSPNPIPWFDCDERLRLNHPDERRLISELVGMVDNIECPDVRGSMKWGKAALTLSQAFENFWRNCRIWGEVKIMSPELAQARLGLLMATQSVLKFVLEEKLKIFAPPEL